MAGLGVPNDPRATEATGAFTRTWWHFFAAVARKLNAGSQVTEVTTADASDPTTTQALVNELKTRLNDVIRANKA